MRTAKQEAFVEEYCKSGNAAQSAIKAGYSEKVAKQKGYLLKEQFAREIEEKTKKMLQDCVPGALAQLQNLSSGARVDQTISHAEMSNEELMRELKALTGSTEVEEIPQLVN